ncbi:MAG: ABC transporter substrate-binding protein [Firmicutes bacterium]|nr:ABC transporter substrate-binding protein [Bacillota bacterium]
MKRCLICLALVMALLLSCLPGAYALTKAGIDISKPVKLYGYLMGSAPPGMPEVMAELNKKLKKDLNCTMEINYIGWGDMQAKYPLVLAAGEDVDWVYTANWCFYAQESAKGAFMEITQDILKKYMPKHFKATNPAAWREALINGKIYMIPTSTPDRKVGCALIRGDLRKKYGVPEIKKFSDIEKYLEAIKKNEPGMIPMNLDSTYDITRPWYSLFYEAGPFWQDILFTTGGGSGVVFDPEDPEGKLYMITEEPVLSYYKNAAKTIKAWNAKDYFNKDAFANKIRSKDSFDQGKSAVGFGNTQDIQGNLANAQSKGWQVEVIPQLSAKGHYPADPYINNGVAIAARSKNWQRAMMALDLIMEDPEYNNLVYFGIIGKNYIIKNGKVDLPKGVTAEKNTYPPDAAGFWFTNKDQFKPMATWTDDYIKLRSNLKTMLAPNIYAAFAPNTDSIKTEMANLNQILVQYLNPIGLGMVDDIEKAFATLDEKLKAAGIEKVKAELTKQTKAYLSSLK